MKKLIKNPKFIIPSVIVLLLLLVVAGSYAFYETDILNTFTRKVNTTGSTEEMKAVSITSSTNSILLNLTKDQLSLPAGSILYGVSSGTASEEATNVELGTLTTDSGAASCDITMTVTFGNKDLINALVSTNELELNIGGVTTDLYSKKGVSSFNVLVEDFYVDTDGETLYGNLMYHILSGSQESEKGKSAGLTISYSSMSCVNTKVILPYKIGDFVTYDAGTWTQEEIASIQVGPNSSLVSANNSLSKPTLNYQFGGFTVGTSRNSGAVEYDATNYMYAKMYDNGNSSNQVALSGWRIWDIDEENEIVTIVSAANPEDYYHGSSTNSAYISQYILTGTKKANWSEASTAESTYTIRDWSMYENDAYGATNARMLNETDLTNWYNKNLGASISDTLYNQSTTFKMIYTEPYLKYQNLIDNHTLYWLVVANDSAWMRFVSTNYRVVNISCTHAYGARLLVSIPLESLVGSEDIGDRTVTLDGMKYNGGTYGTETIQTYNIWELNEVVYYAYGDPTTSSPTTPPAGKNVYAALYPGGEKAVCINRNSTQHCFKNNNWAVEKQHIPEVFSDISCNVYSSYVRCNASDFLCQVFSNGLVGCDDRGTNEYCNVNSAGDVHWREV